MRKGRNAAFYPPISKSDPAAPESTNAPKRLLISGFHVPFRDGADLAPPIPYQMKIDGTSKMYTYVIKNDLLEYLNDNDVHFGLTKGVFRY